MIKNEALRTQVLLAVITARVQKHGDTSPHSVPGIYEFIDAVMQEESKRVYDRDLKTFDSILKVMHQYMREERWDRLEMIGTLFLASAQTEEPKSLEVTALILKVSELVTRKRDVTPEQLAQAIVGHFEVARANIVAVREKESGS